MTITVDLKSPITSYGQELKQLTLTEPKGSHVRKCGLPFTIEFGKDGDEKMSYNFDMKSVAKYIEVLGNIASHEVDQLSPSDFMQVALALTPFFTP